MFQFLITKTRQRLDWVSSNCCCIMYKSVVANTNLLRSPLVKMQLRRPFDTYFHFLSGETYTRIRVVFCLTTGDCICPKFVATYIYGCRATNMQNWCWWKLLSVILSVSRAKMSVNSELQNSRIGLNLP